MFCFKFYLIFFLSRELSKQNYTHFIYEYNQNRRKEVTANADLADALEN